MAARYPEVRERVFQRFPFMRSSAFERRMLFQRAGGPQPAQAQISGFERVTMVPQASAAG